MTAPSDVTGQARPALRRVLTFRDLFLYYVVTGFSLRWVAVAAAAGPSAIVVWIIAALGFFVPLVFSVLELSSRYPEEGGIYVWSKRAFGPFAAFITGWTYWGSNLPYFPGLLYFGAANALFIGGPSWQALSSNSTYFILVAATGLTIAVTMNVVGLNVGKWLNNVGAIAGWIPAALLIALGIAAWGRFGSATPMNGRAFVPSTSLKDIIFWSTIAFAFGGVESASTMGEEIKEARRTIPRAILAAGAVITVLYIAATLSVLLAMPRDQVSGLQGIMQAVQAITASVGLGWLAPIVAALVTLNALGGVGSWFAATARLPFVAGIDRFLPPAFGRLHPTWRTPYVALLVQAAIAGLFVFLGQAGTSVRGAYDALVSMGIIAYFIPFLFMFAAMIVLQREPAGPDVMRVPGGKRAAIALAAIGFVVTAVSIVLACIPPDEEPNKMLAVVKVVGSSLVLVGIGVVVYMLGRRRARAIASVALVCGLAAALPAAAAPPTMRLDYCHSGHAKEEHYSSAILYSRGFSSIYRSTRGRDASGRRCGPSPAPSAYHFWRLTAAPRINQTKRPNDPYSDWKAYMQDDLDDGMGIPDDELAGGLTMSDMGDGGGAEGDDAESGEPAGRPSGGARAKSSGARKSGGARKASQGGGGGSRKAAPKKKGGARKAAKSAKSAKPARKSTGAKKKGGARKAMKSAGRTSARGGARKGMKKKKSSRR